jgi:hypothetical protein
VSGVRAALVDDMFMRFGAVGLDPERALRGVGRHDG